MRDENVCQHFQMGVKGVQQTFSFRIKTMEIIVVGLVEVYN